MSQLINNLNSKNNLLRNNVANIKRIKTINLEILNIEKEETARKIKEFDSEKDDISKNLYELKQQKIQCSAQNQNQIGQLQQQIKYLESEIQNSNKPTSVYFLFDQNDMSILETNYKNYCQQAKIKSNILYYSSSSNKGFFTVYSFTKCLETITEQLQLIYTSQKQNNSKIQIKLIVNSQQYQSYQNYEQKINLLIEKVTQIIRSGYELKIHIFDKNCGDQICFYHLYTQLEKVANVIYQNLITCTNKEGLESDHQQYDVEKKQKSQIIQLNNNLEKLLTSSQEQSKLQDPQISMLQKQLIKKENEQQVFIQKQKNNQQKINELGQQVLNNQMELNNLQSTLTLKQNDLSTQNKNQATLENMLKTEEQKKYISSYQDQLKKIIQECEDLKKQISSLEMTQKKQKTLTETLEDLIQKLGKFYQGIQLEILVLYSFVYQFSGEDDLLLLMFALSFDSKTQYIDVDYEKNLQKVFGLDQRNSQIFLEYIQVQVERLGSNQINIIFKPNHKDEINIGKLNEIISYVQPKITETAKQNILKLTILNTKELMIQFQKQNIKRTN
ncbi:hypothetical protein TTHERM_00193280 (macronuclear) [Tetrahymena thermophila SB210]|uniref:Uncharacterized protein n=1 Tax=Tetrahymena thermophila (strain SB210) TaxID=312017 RepID=Q23KK7_TETTS|nr:hypothetical protein TTHERM_00193280 [Tetrahymena thermophila SB210]EAR96836.2 hypothetical protein TTHERM_00193280 [Tetrahymena thermophila SB210]|eukprot:XP_001017081.2 hypothetical protein TTHERM_00193280 [Tetrahymena thermophila SB210]